MTDLGVYNFVKREISKGTPKEDIAASLAKGGWTQEEIERAYEDARTGNVANVTSTLAGEETEYQRAREDNRAAVGFLLGWLALAPWAISYANMQFKAGIPHYELTVYIAAVFCGVGLFFALWGFWRHRFVGFIAVLLCLFNLLPLAKLYGFEYGWIFQSFTDWIAAYIPIK